MAGGSRGRLINAARRSMIQRAELHRKLDAARAALKPKALLDRGKYRARASLDDAAYIVREEFRDNRLPIAIAAGAGLTWLFREQIMNHAPRAAQKLRAMIDGLRGAPDETEPQETENDDEAPQ